MARYTLTRSPGAASRIFRKRERKVKSLRQFLDSRPSEF